MSGGGKALVLFEKLDRRVELSMLVQQVKAQWSDRDLERVKDLQKFALDKEGAWVLDKAVVEFAGDVLRSFSADTKVRLLRVLAVCALKDGFVHFLNQDRERRHLMNYANRFAELSLDEQKSLATLFCNLFAKPQTRSWILYFSQWCADLGDGDEDGSESDDCGTDDGQEPRQEPSSDQQPHQNGEDPLNGNVEVGKDCEIPQSKTTSRAGEETSNARTLCKVARLCLESLNPALQDCGSAIAYNIAIRDVKAMQRPLSIDDSLETEDVAHSALCHPDRNMATLRAYDAIALELALSIYLLLRRGPKGCNEVVQWRCLTALLSFMPLIRNDLQYFNEHFKEETHDLLDFPSSERNNKLILELVAQVAAAVSTLVH